MMEGLRVGRGGSTAVNGTGAVRRRMTGTGQREHRANRFNRARTGQVRAYRKRVGSLYLAGISRELLAPKRGRECG